MAAHEFTTASHPHFQQLLDHLTSTTIRRVDNTLRQSLPACEYEDPDFGMCGRIAKVTDRDSERPLCGLHFHMIQLGDALEVLRG